MRLAIVLIFISVFLLPGAAAQSGGTISLWSDTDRCHMYAEPSSPFELFSCWIFIYPDAEGAMCLEFQIDLPDNVVLIDYELNPIFGITIDPITPWVAPGASWCFDPCQTDWFWTHRTDLLAMNSNPSQITVIPHGDTESIAATTCLGVETEMQVDNMFCVNQYCGIITPYIPRLTGIGLATGTILVARFEPLIDSAENRFISGYVQAIEHPEDMIEVIESMPNPIGDGSLVLTLASPMTDARYYLLNANTCGRCDCGLTSKPFYFDDDIAADESSWGAIKKLGR
ncbi:MAG: hypothetical protein JW814_01725 [Candidatus Krumholzibacteriota bacterium]|nr:hypothetical protein [Candidatus Krumholzibacteriota bacterium]